MQIEFEPLQIQKEQVEIENIQCLNNHKVFTAEKPARLVYAEQPDGLGALSFYCECGFLCYTPKSSTTLTELFGYIADILAKNYPVRLQMVPFPRPKRRTEQQVFIYFKPEK